MLCRLTRGHSRSRSSAEATEARAENFFQAYLDAYAGMGLEIEQQGRRMIAASVGGHHDQPFAVFEVVQGAGTRPLRPVVVRSSSRPAMIREPMSPAE